MTNSVVRGCYSVVPEFWAFLPLVSLMENYEADDELNNICTAMLAVLAQSLVLPEFMPTALCAIQEVNISMILFIFGKDIDKLYST